MSYMEPPIEQDRMERRDPEPAIEDSCIECGKYAALRCGCCGFPLCGKHHELGAGFCSSKFSVGGVSICLYDQNAYVGVFPREETVVHVVNSDTYHLPDEEDSDQLSCRDDHGQRLTLDEANDRDLELCEDCVDEARERYEAFQEELRADLEGGDSDE